MATTKETAKYAIISLGGKQYVVREGERLLVDRVRTDEGKTFNPGVLFVGGDGAGSLAPQTQVTARVVGHVRGDKIRIGKYRPKNGYRRHTGFRSSLTQIEIESIGGRGGAAKRTSAPAEPAEPAEAAEQHTVTSEETTSAQPPRGYADFTVAEIGEKAKRWKPEQLEAALAYEQDHANRKGALAALESALEAKRES
jgi:large subunit ribosomal protein L21